MGLILNRRRAYSAHVLPAGYREVEYIQNVAQSCCNTGITFDGDIELYFEIYCPQSNVSFYAFQTRASTTGTIYGITGSSADGSISWGNSVLLKSGVYRHAQHSYAIKGTQRSDMSTLYVKDLTAGNEDTQEVAIAAGTSTTPIMIFGNTITAQYLVAGHRINKAYIIKDGVLHQFIPCKNPNGVAGFFNTATREFRGSATANAFIAGPEVESG